MSFEMNTTLEEKSVVLNISDPWDLGERLNWKSLSAVVIAVDNNSTQERIILRLVEPFEYKSIRCEYFVASPRHENCQINDLLRGVGVFCGLTRIPDERLHSADPFDLEWWRGGPALIGELLLEEIPTGSKPDP